MPNRPKKSKLRGFPGGPEVKTLSSNAGGEGLIPAGELSSHMPWDQKTKT